MINSLGYLGFGVSDADAWHTFATGVLGLMPVPADGARRYRVDSLAWRISVENGADDVLYTGYEVADAAALGSLVETLSSAGIEVTAASAEELRDRGVLGMSHCVDPDGLRVELFYGPTESFDRPFASPAGISGFNTGEQGLGHVVLSARDIAAARAFYVDLLGFRLSDVISVPLGGGRSLDLEFYHCNARHHTLALVPMPTPKRMHHFMLEANTLDEVGFAFDQAERGGAPIAQTIGRHTNDQMVSFYARTPSGFEVEFGWGGLPVDSATWRVARHEKMSSWGHKRPANTGA